MGHLRRAETKGPDGDRGRGMERPAGPGSTALSLRPRPRLSPTQLRHRGKPMKRLPASLHRSSVSEKLVWLHIHSNPGEHSARSLAADLGGSSRTWANALSGAKLRQHNRSNRSGPTSSRMYWATSAPGRRKNSKRACGRAASVSAISASRNASWPQPRFKPVSIERPSGTSGSFVQRSSGLQN